MPWVRQGLCLLILLSAPRAFASLMLPLFSWQMEFASIHLPRPQIAIIIDDLGYSYYSGKLWVEFPADLTLAFIPFTPHGQRLAEAAHRSGKEVMLHAPMETIGHRAWEPSLDLSMDRHQLVANLGAMLQNIPHVKGVNNHGGSLLTQDLVRMEWIMGALSDANMYFIDSRTTSKSLALKVARSFQLSSQKRDVFLDNDRNVEAIKVQLRKLRNLAFRNGQALAIGHPYPETFKALSEEISKLKFWGIRVIPVSEYLSTSKSVVIDGSKRVLVSELAYKSTNL